VHARPLCVTSRVLCNTFRPQPARYGFVNICASDTARRPDRLVGGPLRLFFPPLAIETDRLCFQNYRAVVGISRNDESRRCDGSKISKKKKKKKPPRQHGLVRSVQQTTRIFYRTFENVHVTTMKKNDRKKTDHFMFRWSVSTVFAYANKTRT